MTVNLGVSGGKWGLFLRTLVLSLDDLVGVSGVGAVDDDPDEPDPLDPLPDGPAPKLTKCLEARTGTGSGSEGVLGLGVGGGLTPGKGRG